MSRSYEIKFDGDYVCIDGELTIEETFDFLSFYEKKGFNRVTSGVENSTLHLCKVDSQGIESGSYEKELQNEIHRKENDIINQRHEINLVNVSLHRYRKKCSEFNNIILKLIENYSIHLPSEIIKTLDKMLMEKTENEEK